MSRHRAIVGLCVLCALVFSAISAQGAAAATNGTTAETCGQAATHEATHGFKDHECTEAEIGLGTEFENFPFFFGTGTSVTNITTETKHSLAKLESQQAGITEQIVSNTVTGSGSMENKTAANGEHYAEGTGTLEYLEVEVTKPAGKGCKVKGGKIVTKKLTATTKEQGMFVKVMPFEGTVLAEFEVEGCSTAALNGAYKVEGSLKAVPNGITIVCGHVSVTEQKTLKVRGQTAGLDGSVVVSGREGGSGAFTPLMTRTVETP